MNQIPNFFKNKPRDYPKGQILLYQGDKTQNTYRIIKGYVIVKDITSDGDNKILLVLGPGDIYPLVWDFKKTDRLIYFYEAMTDVEISYASKKELLSEITNNHELTLGLFKYFIEKTKQLMLRIECLEASNATFKVAQVIDYLASTHAKPTHDCFVKIVPPITHQDIADMTGLARETASTHIKNLEESAVISQSPEGLVIDTDKLDKLLSAE